LGTIKIHSRKIKVKKSIVIATSLALFLAAISIIAAQPGKAAELKVNETSNGTLKATIGVNGFGVNGYIDTGASLLYLNGKTWCDMVHADTVKPADMMELSESMMANGSKVPIVIYRVTVRIGKAILKNVQAMSPVGVPTEICKDKSPNLIGQSVLSRFDSVTFTRSGRVILSDQYLKGN
jgi:predicted aspartyl protease